MPTRFKWSLISDERLLDTRICDLPIRIKGSFLETNIKRLYSELNDRCIRFKPHVWLSAEWFTPDGVPGFAIPFYLAHPRLKTLELHQMLEVEGGTADWCQQLLRHEAGHAIDHAYKFSSRPRWHEVFGSPDTESVCRPCRMPCRVVMACWTVASAWDGLSEQFCTLLIAAWTVGRTAALCLR